MSSPRTLLIQYRYDPLDRLVTCTPASLPSQQRFYQKDRLATEIHGIISHSIFQQEELLLAQQQRQGTTTDTTLLATDQQRSVLHTLDKAQRQAIAYSPYGHHALTNGSLSLLGFNGERADPVTGHYLLGNGHRAFNTVLMRFNSPDRLSPFGKGGVNAYAYGLGDPLNRVDPTGQFAEWLPSVLAIATSMLNFKVAIFNTPARTSPSIWAARASLIAVPLSITGVVMQLAGNEETKKSGQILAVAGAGISILGLTARLTLGVRNILRAPKPMSKIRNNLKDLFGIKKPSTRSAQAVPQGQKQSAVVSGPSGIEPEWKPPPRLEFHQNGRVSPPKAPRNSSLADAIRRT
ncbi:RHS repeat-associated core domain-containing protein [Pseudomonas batumici]|uniref:YD repeat protein n=1 Tax=Pseudomonas batumici TaxID=226910 RepID=A0A0C2HVL4_9PSED|nr:RHS repeat-associated core domain-containing protein [Pseudomonas batumici]KIH81196.1 YD repeat protein [Pseudomonas batumici]